MTAPSRYTYNEVEQDFFVGWILAVRSITQNPALILPARTLQLRNGGTEYNGANLTVFATFLVTIFPNITTLEIEAKLLSTSPIYKALLIGQKAAKKWTNIDRLTICGHFNHDTEEEYEKVVAGLGFWLENMREGRMLKVKEARLSVDRSIQPPVGRVSVKALREQVGELIIELTGLTSY